MAVSMNETGIVTNSVNYLKSLNFMELTRAEKVLIKDIGRDTPDLIISAPANSKGKVYIRKFNSDIYQKHDWLTGCSERNSLFCFPCLLYGSDTPWTGSGVNDLNHLQSKIKKHEASVNHVNNVIDLSLLGQSSIVQEINIGYQIIIARHNEKVRKNRTMLSKIIDCIKFCGKFELPIRGHDESSTSLNSGVFHGLLDFITQFDQSFKSPFESDSDFNGISETFQNDILDSILQICQQAIKAEIQAADFLAVMVDETTDVSDKSQVAVVFRYVKENRAVERFWNFLNPSNLSATTISSIIINELEPLIGNFSEKLIAQTYDGAVVLSGVNSGVQVRVREVYSNAHFLHCYAHQLNLTLLKAVSQNNHAKIFLNNFSDIPTFFSKSPQRMAALENVISRRHIPHPSSTRWNFQIQTVNQVFEMREEIVECCTELEASSCKETGSAAGSIKRLLCDSEFLFWLQFLAIVMPHADILFNQLQAREIDANKASECIQLFKTNVQNAKDTCTEIGASTKANENDWARYSEERSIAAKQVCDVLMLQCQERFRFVGHSESSRLFDTTQFCQYSRQFPIIMLEHAVKYYPMLNKNKLYAELNILYKRQELSHFKSLTELLILLYSLNLCNTFSEVTKLIKILLTTPMTTDESERCFSTLKRVETFGRSTMGNDKLGALAMLSIESELVASLKDFNEKVIDLFSIPENRRMDFIYMGE